MEIQKVFSDMYDEERLYSVLLDEDEMALFSVMKDELEGAGAAALAAGTLAGAGYGITKGAKAIRESKKMARDRQYIADQVAAREEAVANAAKNRESVMRQVEKEVKKKNPKLRGASYKSALNKEMARIEELLAKQEKSNIKKAVDSVKRGEASRLEKIAASIANKGTKVGRHIGNNKLAYGLGAGATLLGAGAINAARKN